MAKKSKKYIIGIDEVGRAASKRRASPYKYIIGIDEVGRGPLAGPVTVAAVLLPRNFQLSISHFQRKNKIKLRDSKKLSPKKREEWFKYVKNHPKIHYTVASVPPKTIDKINISQAANLAATRALEKLITQLPNYLIADYKVFLDGGLHINSKFKNQKSKIQFKIKNFKSQTMIKGDELVPAISLASIVAKVHRDKYMKRLHKKYPRYSFDKHKGYGTRRHFQKIKQNGISKIHRKSFLKNLSL